MPRRARPYAPFSYVHLISRFADRRYRLERSADRRAYLTRAGRVLANTDWRAIAYALMSTHVHWLMLAGVDPSWRFTHALHTRFAHWISRRQGRLGSVFAARHSSFIVPIDRVPRAIAYLHNNPVRAGIVHRAGDSDWTSHRAYPISTMRSVSRPQPAAGSPSDIPTTLRSSTRGSRAGEPRKPRARIQPLTNETCPPPRGTKPRMTFPTHLGFAITFVALVGCGSGSPAGGNVGTSALGVTCGSKQCAAGEECCLSGSANGVCMSSCSGGALRVRCDGAEDCDGGNVCCGPITDVSCHSSCESKPTVCHSSADCPSGKSCGAVQSNDVTVGFCL